MFNTSILMLEDNADLLYLYEEALSGIKRATIDKFTNPKEGLQFAIANKPDIIITDNMMPFVDGLYVAEKVREVYDPKIILVSAISSRMVDNSKLLCFDKCFKKPFNILELADTVDEMIVDINLRKKEILDKVMSGFFADINCTGKNRLFVENVVRTLMYDTDRPSDNSMYAILSKELEKDPCTIRRNINKVVDHTYEPSLFQRIMGLKKKPKSAEFINTLLEKINEQAKKEKW